MIWEKKFSITKLGRKRYFEDKDSFEDSREYERWRSSILREGDNFVIQAGCADITKLALIYIQRSNPFGNKLNLLLQVHDEIICEVEESIVEPAKKFIEEQMLNAERYFIKLIPCAVDVKDGDYWVH